MSAAAASRKLLFASLACLFAGVPSLPALASDHIPDWMRQVVASAPASFDKDAKAVVLLDETTLTIQRNGMVDETRRRVVKILRPQGREYADLQTHVSNDIKIRWLRAWSLGSHGEEYEMKEKDFWETNFSEDLYNDLHVKRVRPPGADPGAVVAMEVQKIEKPYFPQRTWQFQEDIPVHLARLIVEFPEGWEYKTYFFQHAAIEPTAAGNNKFIWEVRDLPGIKEQPSMPPAESLLGRMSLSYFGGENPVNLSSWALIGRWYAQLTDDRRNDSPELATKAQQLTVGLTSTFDKAATLALFLQMHNRYVEISIGIGGYQPHFASDVFQHGYGDCKDKSTLLSSMLRDVGIASQLVLVNTERGTVVPEIPSTFFDHVVLAIRWPGNEPVDPRIHAMVTDSAGVRWVLFDPTNAYTPFGEVDDWLEQNYVLLTADSGGELLRLPLNKPEWNQRTRSGHLKLGEDGTLSGEVEESLIGDLASYSRLRLTYQSESERRRYADNFLSSFLSSFVLEDFKIENLDQNNKPLLIRYKFTDRNYARRTGSLLLVRPRVLGQQIIELDQEPRKYPVSIQFTQHETDRFDIELPAGYTVDELPDPANTDVGFAAFHSKAEFHNGVLSYQDEYTVRDVSVGIDHVGDVQRLNGVVVGDQRGLAILKKASN